MELEIVDAREAGLLEAVYRLRYKIYVTEMGRRQPTADHAARRVEDDLDATAIVLAALDRQTWRVAGTVRLNLLRDGSTPLYRQLYELDAMTPEERAAASITTRLMVDAAYRGSSVSMRLALELYRIGIAAQAEINYADCNDPQVPLCLRLGYRWQRHIEHPDYGRVNLMRLALRDRPHLASIGSPLLTVLDRQRR